MHALSAPSRRHHDPYLTYGETRSVQPDEYVGIGEVDRKLTTKDLERPAVECLESADHISNGTARERPGRGAHRGHRQSTHERPPGG